MSEEKQEGQVVQLQLLRLLGQGKDGCIYDSGIRCNSTIGDPLYVTKIQKKTERILRELAINKTIRTIKHYDRYFAPCLETCDVSIDSFKNLVEPNDVEKCKPIAESKSERGTYPDFVSTKIRYIEKNMNLADYFVSIKEKPRWFLSQKIETTFAFLLHSLKKLQDKNMIHFDIKEKNILFDYANQVPIIIDFGISFLYSNTMTVDERKTNFYYFDFYDYWCLDIFMISSIAHRTKEQELVTEESLDKLFTSFQTKIEGVGEKMEPIITKEEWLQMKKNYTELFQSYIGGTWESIYQFLFVENSFWKSWDVYSVAVSYLLISKDVGLKGGHTEKLSALWKEIVLAMPNKRKSLEEVLQEIKKTPLS
jgi:serine/threonine protein kinase